MKTSVTDRLTKERTNRNEVLNNHLYCQIYYCIMKFFFAKMIKASVMLIHSGDAWLYPAPNKKTFAYR